ncbi:heparinase II/III domain-containing protein [Spirosoma gilvum]
MNRIGLIWRTIRHLSARQVLYQLRYRLQGWGRLQVSGKECIGYFLDVPDADKPLSWRPGAFTFLNQSVYFSTWVNWNYSQLGKLWTYHLNYFDFLNQPQMRPEIGLILIRDFIAQTTSLQDGLESYPTSLRIMNWVCFLSKHQIQDDAINRHLFAQVRLLNQRMEYHLGGNHLIENGFALLTVSLFFRNNRWAAKADRLLTRELTRQILADGGHDERSPVYHQILLNRLLDTLKILQTNSWYNNPRLLHFLTKTASRMLAWLHSVTFRNGDVPLVNDSALGMAPTTAQLDEKAKAIFPELVRKEVQLRESGYRMFRQNRYELFANVGAIGQDHQSGHAHADTLSFILYVDNLPVMVDAGTSTYEIGAQRSWERSTIAHNTVTIKNRNSSEVWASFRVGRRARVRLFVDNETELTARHDGYRFMNVLHQRTWRLAPDQIIITDSLLSAHTEAECGQLGIARYHFQPGLVLQLVGDIVQAGSIKIRLKSDTKLKYRVSTFSRADGFNQISPGQCLEVAFTNRLETTFLLSE